MVKLTADLINDAPQYINAVLDRELTLRGWKIPTIENIGVTNNQFDTIDFTNNDLRKLENFPQLPRLKCLLMANNRISYIDPDLGKYLPKLTTLVLTNNNMTELGDLDSLKMCERLQYLTLMGNPVTKKQHYRLYVIATIPSVRVLDFRRIRQKERETAEKLFKGKKGTALKEQLGKKTAKTFTPGELPEAVGASSTSAIANGLPAKDPAEVERIKEAIKSAKTLQEVEHLKQLLESGQPLPVHGLAVTNGNDQSANDVEVEEEEDEEPVKEMEDNTKSMDTTDTPTSEPMQQE